MSCATLRDRGRQHDGSASPNFPGANHHRDEAATIVGVRYIRAMSPEKDSKAVTAYIAAAPPQARVMLRRIRSAIKAAAPRAHEKLSYGMPYYGHNGRLAYFAAFRNHVSVFIPGRVLDAFAQAVAPYRRGKATLQFPIGTKVPVGLIGRLVRARRRENDED